MRSIFLFLTTCILALGAFMLLNGGRRTERISIEQPDPLPMGGKSARISYLANAYPQFDLPDGRKEVVKSVLASRPLRFGRFLWDEKGVAAGDIWVRIDLKNQVLSVFRAGHEIGSTVILYGTDGKPTPIGSFTIQQMAADYHSRTYDAPMPFMLRLTDDGVAIHASEVKDGSATHGCIGVPRAFARLLFAQAKLGDRVFILPAEETRKS